MSSPSADVVELGGVSGGSAGTIRSAELIQFATLWAPYGGGSDEDIFVTFGVSSKVYFARLAKLLATHASLVPDESTRAEMLAVCDRRSGGEARQTRSHRGGAARSAQIHEKFSTN
ncbi:hypothetical protein CJ178_17555 [Rhodococcus sp. ACPA4]|uniref:hypothetical protein n=1 Tax=Rhodococcus TaxID=1827 RepID=UPI000BB10128|nr:MULTISPECIES: hypothetical protein [Rhodococcus]PBC43152.1 hypothetical protein CJ178_17555 [Rhodococcus sp. ACPA4]QXW00034.1 hypothetical protein KYT97_16445 [Rhodococcus globerulus]RZL25741.1 MAG: hypothetical protein EOP31_07585 [Rhodococcus sp. (in: high G+C Gram-positive bacteria)]